MKQPSASLLSAIEPASRTVQARKGLHLMEWKHQEAGPSVSTSLIGDNKTVAHSSLRINTLRTKRRRISEQLSFQIDRDLESQTLLDFLDSDMRRREEKWGGGAPSKTGTYNKHIELEGDR